jgi:hypothetical protein
MVVLPIRFLVLVVAANAFVVNWSRSGQGAITIRATGLEESVDECLESARQAKIRFEMRMCRRNRAWFDSCAEARSELHTIEFDSISESYRVVSDRYRDDTEPVAVGIPSRNEAVRTVTTVESLSLDFLARGDTRLAEDPDTYIQVRTTFSCKGAVNRTFARLSQILTLGLVNVVESESPWTDFDSSQPAKPK